MVEVVNFDAFCADAYSHLRLSLTKVGRIIPEADLMIASTALAHNALLVTHDTNHFNNLPGLQIEDWLA